MNPGDKAVNAGGGEEEEVKVRQGPSMCQWTHDEDTVCQSTHYVGILYTSVSYDTVKDVASTSIR